MSRFTVDPGVLLSAFISPRKSAPALILDALLDASSEQMPVLTPRQMVERLGLDDEQPATQVETIQEQASQQPAAGERER